MGPELVWDFQKFNMSYPLHKCELSCLVDLLIFINLQLNATLVGFVVDTFAAALLAMNKLMIFILSDPSSTPRGLAI